MPPLYVKSYTSLLKCKAVEGLKVCVIYESSSKNFAPHYFFQPLTKIEKCSFAGLKSDVSPARIPSFESFWQIDEL
jgi:hypothetical protein